MPIIVRHHDVQFFPHHPNPQLLIEQAGRLCYKSEGKICNGSDTPFIRSICKRGHESVIEHGVASFKIICDRGISHEIVRHRIASYSQESTRYVKYGDDENAKNPIQVVAPAEVINGKVVYYDDIMLDNYESLGLNIDQFYSYAHQYTEWYDAQMFAAERYSALLALGAKPQTARGVLPTDLKTEIMVTMNFRSWLHFIELRKHTSAHPKIRLIAEDILTHLEQYAPAVFKAE